jgi:flavin reductase
MKPSNLSQIDFREGMARMGAAVNIITTDGASGRAGFTASAVCSVTDSPPTLLVCLNRSASVYEAFIRNNSLCVNTLRPDHEQLSRLFGGKTPMEERFAAATWTKKISGAPVLEGAAVAFDCQVFKLSEVGTHSVLFCEVIAIERHESASGLIYFDRGYHRI